jgi:hypothetical protein
LSGLGLGYKWVKIASNGLRWYLHPANNNYRQYKAFLEKELVNTIIVTLSALDQTIQNVAKQIERYQHQIENQLKRIT